MKREIGDNLSISVRARNKENFDLAMNIALSFTNGKVEYYCIHEDYGIILFWTKPEDKKRFEIVSLPKMGIEGIKAMMWEVLNNLDINDFKLSNGEQDLDHDGSNERGFRIYNENWGHVAGFHEAFVAIKPAYIWMGK